MKRTFIVLLLIVVAIVTYTVTVLVASPFDDVLNDGNKYKVVHNERDSIHGLSIYEIKHKTTGKKYLFVCNMEGAGLLEMR